LAIWRQVEENYERNGGVCEKDVYEKKDSLITLIRNRKKIIPSAKRI